MTLKKRAESAERPKWRRESATRQPKFWRIAHMRQIEALRWRRRPEPRAITPRKQFTDPAFTALPAPNLGEHRGNISHHMQQEGIGFDIKHHQITKPADRDTIDVSPSGRRLTAGGSHRTKVLLAQQRLRRSMHGVFVEVWTRPPLCATQRLGGLFGVHVQIATR